MTYSKTILAAVVAVLAMPLITAAATISLSPTSISVTPGQTFTIAVTTNPAGSTLYTVKADVSFDPAIVEVTNFAFASGWMPLTQPGYDAIDNSTGKLIKTGGYPGGITGTKLMGTITFKAKAAGTAVVNTTGASLALDQTSSNALSGTQGSVSVTSAPAVVPEPVAATTDPDTTPAPGTSSETVGSTFVGDEATTTDSDLLATTTEATSTPEDTNANTGQLAAAAFSGSAWWFWLIILLIGAGSGGAWYVIKRRRF